MRFLYGLVVVFILALAAVTPGRAMGSGPHPTVPYGIPMTPTHGPQVLAATTGGPADVAAAPSIWDHQIYVIAIAIAGGELLLWMLMVAGKASRRGEEESD